MTLIMAIECSDGMLLASDSQLTYATQGQPTRRDVEKIFCPWSNVALVVSSNHGGVSEQVATRLTSVHSHRTKFENKRREDIIKELTTELTRAVKSILTTNFTGAPGISFPPFAFLFGGYGTNGPFILEVHQDGLATNHTSDHFGAVGSGEIFPYYALPALANFDIPARPITQGKLITYRVMDDAIRVAGQFIGPPIQMIAIDRPNPPTHPARSQKMSPDDLLIIRDDVLGWKTLESETLTQYGLPAVTPTVSAEPK